ncbi:E3 ubiquitin ligase [Halostella litorea]|uniref:E3 ubiquitin ligase n=1 Tax=Halostella litorea TaxID=2528831 RepID=UPI001092BFA5|nr:E3 ubiquitin ligase [Halostella litorea]
MPAVTLATALFAAVALVGVALLADAGRHGLRAYRVRSNEPIPVGAAADESGVVEVEGVAERHERSLVAPFSGEECLVCEYEVLELQSSGKTSSWNTIKAGGGSVPFAVSDGTGRLLVEPAGAKLALDEHVTRVGGGDRPPERIARWIEDTPDVDSEEKTWDLRVIELKAGNDRKYVERRVDPGDAVHVYGGSEYRRWSDAGGAVNVAIRDGLAPLFRITDGDERAAVRGLAVPALYRLAGAAVVFLLLLVLVPSF